MIPKTEAAPGRHCRQDCPGCHPGHRDAKESARRKTDWLNTRLAPWADRIRPIRTTARNQRFHYRDKTCLSAQWTGRQWRFGLRAADTLIPVFNCPVHTGRVNRTAGILSRTMPPEDRFPLKYFAQSGAQAVLVLKSAQMPDTDWMDHNVWSDLKEAGLEGLWVHLFPSAGRRVFAKNTWRLLEGKPRSYDASGMMYGPTTFRQPIPELHADALECAASFLSPGSADRVIDLYCGSGAGLSRWTALGAGACGVEISGESADCAAHNAPRATVLRGTCTDRIAQLNPWISAATPAHRLIYANPPRTGLEPELVQWIAEKCTPARMVYTSCSAGTLRRDLDFLCKTAFTVHSIHPYDFFPNTRHVEVSVFIKGPDCAPWQRQDKRKGRTF